MATQTVNVALPDEIYRRLQKMATATHRSLEEILVQTIRGNLPPIPDDVATEQRHLMADLEPLDDDALWVLAKAPLPAQDWRRHQRLLRRAESAALAPAEQAELVTLREATDRHVMERSVALALLKWRGHTIPATL